MFDGTVNVPVMHRAVKAYLTNQREGNASTKTRGFVIGGNQKPWRQKGTGRARQGSIRSPLWPGGGTVFGPLPKDYDERIPRKMRALARKSALNARAREEAIFVIDRFTYEAPRTRTLVSLLDRLGVAGQKALVLTDGLNATVYLSGRNLPNVQVMPYAEASTYHVLWSDVVLIESSALGYALEPVAEKDASGAQGKAAAAPAEAPAAKKKKKSAGRRREKGGREAGRQEPFREAGRAEDRVETGRRASPRPRRRRGSNPWRPCIAPSCAPRHRTDLRLVPGAR